LDTPTRLTLLVLAAGLGSRYGGFKQIAPLGEGGEIALDYALFDAWRAGFTEAVFVVRPELETPLRQHLADRLADRLKVRFVYQRLEDLPAGLAAPPGRAKPWGTGHAIWAARDAVTGPFAAINADDFYGPASYRALAAFLAGGGSGEAPLRFAMVGFPLEKTLSPHGAVSRAVCEVDPAGCLAGITEHPHIRRTPSGIVSGRPDGPEIPLSGGETVSMNMWGFTPAVFPALGNLFTEFLETRRGDPGAEFYIPAAVGQLIQRGICLLSVLPTTEEWFGLTFPADRPDVQARLARMTATGRYPVPLWS